MFPAQFATLSCSPHSPQTGRVDQRLNHHGFPCAARLSLTMLSRMVVWRRSIPSGATSVAGRRFRTPVALARHRPVPAETA